jgi:hypothetical protein
MFFLSEKMDLENSTEVFFNETEEVNPAGKDSLFEFVTEGVLLTVISSLGFLGNALSIYVLVNFSVTINFQQTDFDVSSPFYLWCPFAV